MTPRQVHGARRLVKRKWYLRIRSWKMSVMYRHYDSRILQAGPEELAHISEMLTRCAAKLAWYKAKFNEK